MVVVASQEIGTGRGWWCTVGHGRDPGYSSGAGGEVGRVLQDKGGTLVIFFPQREEGGKDIDWVPQDKEKTEVFAMPWEGECRVKVSWVLRDEEVTHVVAI